MRVFTIKIVFILLFFHFQFVSSQVVYKEIKTKIDVEELENIISITGAVENLKSEFKNISFKMTVFKKNITNNSKSDNVQSGRITLEPLKKVLLSKTEINRTKEDKIIILLLVYDENNNIIGKDRIVFGEDEQSNIEVLKTNDGIEMIGIVLNETKTKLGNDFYDYFYSMYSKLKINSLKIVTVQEELTFGRTTKIIIAIDTEVLKEFVAMPDDDFLSYMAENASDEVFKYLKEKEKQQALIFQF